MTRDEIEIEFLNMPSHFQDGTAHSYIVFAEHIAKLEREECANVVDSVLKDFGSDDDGCTANRILNAINEVMK